MDVCVRECVSLSLTTLSSCGRVTNGLSYC